MEREGITQMDGSRMRDKGHLTAKNITYKYTTGALS